MAQNVAHLERVKAISFNFPTSQSLATICKPTQKIWYETKGIFRQLQIEAVRRNCALRQDTFKQEFAG